MVVTGTTLSGGALTLPYILIKSGEVASALLKLSKLLLPSGGQKEQDFVSADRIDDIFYVFAQRAYLKSLSKLKKHLPTNAQFDTDRHAKAVETVKLCVVRPDRVEASFEFGWNEVGSPLKLFDSYTGWLHPLLVSFGADDNDASAWLESVELQARKDLFAELVSKRRDHQWLVDYQLLNSEATIIDLLKGFTTSKSQPSEVAWITYLQDLKKKPTLLIWGEEANGLSIDRLFVEPAFNYTRQTYAGPLKLEPTASLRQFLTGLISHRRPSTELVFVMGGPGSGKTSLMEVFCADLADTDKVCVVLVPAKHLDPRRGILPEVQRYLREMGHQALADMVASSSDFIIAIDGFDELAHATLSTLEEFFRSVQDLVRDRSGAQLRIMLSGRPTLFTSNDVMIPVGSHVVTLTPFDEARVKVWSENWRREKGGSFDGVRYLKSKSANIRLAFRTSCIGFELR
jgi:hypothetical protein